MEHKPFLYRCVEALAEICPDSCEDVLLVFPNRRALQFFEKEFAAYHQRVMVLPELKTISEMLSSQTPWMEADHLTLVQELLKTHNTVLSRTEQLDTFMAWGELLLSDFDEVDKYLVDASLMYKNLSDLKEMDSMMDFLTSEQVETIQRFWRSFSVTADADGSSARFLKIWSGLSEIYSQFKQSLSAQALAYEGMIQRDTIEHLPERMDYSPYSLVVFIGFNQLNSCEEKLFDFTKKQVKTLFYYDADGYYLHDLNHEAGKFLRKNMERFPQALPVLNRFTTEQPKEIHLHAVTGHQSQVKAAAHILNQFPEGETSSTVWMLPDVSMLHPALFSLPPSIQNVNITMGLPIRETLLPSFVESFLQLQKLARSTSDGHIYYHHEAVLQLLKHPYLNDSQPELNSSLCAKINRENLIYVKAELLLLTDLHRAVFAPDPHTEFIPRLIQIFSEVLSQINENEHNDIRVLKSVVNDLHRLNRYFGSTESARDIKLIAKILRQHFSRVSIPFEGELVDSLQLMGPLETRSLDFSSVFVFNVNEGILPADSPGNSYIPVALKAAFGLPLPSDKAAAQSYFFFRLLQGAERIYLFYNIDSEGLKSSEPSRYIFRIENDPHFQVIRNHVSPQLVQRQHGHYEVLKNDSVKKALSAYFAEGSEKQRLSPTAINYYLECPMKFYHTFILRLKEPDEVSPALDPRSFGTLLHLIMERIYTPYLDKMITREDFTHIESQMDDLVNACFAEYFNWTDQGESTADGQSIININIIKAYVRQIIAHDKQYKSLKILHLEIGGKGNRLDLEFPVNTFQGKQTILIDGKIDRVDECNGKIRVVDYKTGMAKMDISDPEKLTGHETKFQNTAALQTILYALMLNHRFPHYRYKIQPTLYVLRDIFKRNFNPVFTVKPKEETPAELQEVAGIQSVITAGITAMMEEIFNDTIPFARTDDRNSCRYCNFASICDRN